jgi:hypothetical protein
MTVAIGGALKKKSMRRGESLTSPRRIKAVTEKQLHAVEFRRLGYTYAQIADALGYTSAQGAHKAVAAALKRVTRGPSDEVIMLELERVDALFVRPYQDALAGDLAALSACLAIMARKCRLLGLDAPVKSGS